MLCSDVALACSHDNNDCRAIDALTRTDLQIELRCCVPTESGEEILLECIRQNRGPTKLFWCRIDTRRLADALRGNNSVTTLALREPCSDEERLVLVEALAENEGIVTLYLNSAPITKKFGLPYCNRLRTTRNSRNLSFFNIVALLGETGRRRMRKRLSGCKPWWMRFASTLCCTQLQ
jgi:hypothetical protein